MSDPVSTATDRIEPVGITPNGTETPAALDLTPSFNDDPPELGDGGLHVFDTGTGQPTAPDPRYDEIDAFLADADHAVERRRFLFVPYDDSATGDRVAGALQGDSPLGTLTPEEQTYMAQEAVERWVDHDNSEAWSEAYAAVEGTGTADRALIDAFARQSAGMDPEDLVTRQLFAMVEHRDVSRLIRAFEGQEADLASRLQTYHPTWEQRPFLEAAAAESVPPASTAAFADAMFFNTSSAEAADPGYAEALATAMARGAVDPLSPNAEAEASLMAERLTQVFGSRSGRDLLFSDEIHPQLRQWAGANVIADPSWTAEALDGGWESDLVGQAYAQSVIDAYGPDGVREFAAHPTDTETLRTAVGLALQLTPDQLEGMTEAELEAFLDGGLDQAVFGENAQIDQVVARIQQIAGADAVVTAVPVTVTSNEFGAMVETVFRVEDQNGDEILIDAQGRRTYDGVEEWITDNELPPGRMHFADGRRAGGDIISDVTPSVNDTLLEWLGTAGDYAALGVGIVAGAALVVGTGGTAALVAAGIAGGYGASRAAVEIIDDAQHGVNVWDPTDAENRANWIEFAAGALSVAAIGGGLRAANLAQNGQRLTGAGAQALARINFAANLADGAAITDQTVQLALNWQDMSPEARANGLLNLAFWGGMTAASTRATGGSPENAFNYRALSDDVSYAAGSMQAAHGHPNETAVRAGASPIEISQADFDRIRAMDIGDRPAPSTYIPQDQIDTHLAMFEDGAARTTNISAYEEYGTIARPGDTFVMPQSAVQEVIAQSNGDLRYIEGALGLPRGALDGGDIGIAFIDSPENLRLPTGNEPGTNEFWEPGGLTSGYVPEAIISTPAPESVTVISIQELIRDAGH